MDASGLSTPDLVSEALERLARSMVERARVAGTRELVAAYGAVGMLASNALTRWRGRQTGDGYGEGPVAALARLRHEIDELADTAKRRRMPEAEALAIAIKHLKEDGKIP